LFTDSLAQSNFRGKCGPMIIRQAFVGILLALSTLTTLAGKSETKGPDPDAILRELYKAQDAGKGPFFDHKNHNLAEKYFTKELAALIVKDAAKSDDELGAIDFDPLYDSQDPQVKNFKIGAVQWGDIRKGAEHPGDDASALVFVTFKDNGEAHELRFTFKQQPDKTWRILDIHYPDKTSLLQILRTAYAKLTGSK
jgi:hypothetical protein